ncbi:hypothetical protein F5Y19DRAFT_483044 [Xylariaceae sp. FL1651]|nr:hypothetical protein F5Y19DRAFT_483044 [Xylariaceae sp. FL1651]
MSVDSSDHLAGLIPPPMEVNDTHKVYSVAAACIVLSIVTSLTVLTRLGIRLRVGGFGADDYVIIPGTALYIGWSVLAIYMNLHAGVGKPLWEITLAEFSLWYKGIVVALWLYPVMSATIRVSTLLFYRRIFGKIGTRMGNVIWILLTLQGVYVVIFSITPAFVCKPLYYAWQPLLHREHCNDIYYYESQVGLYTSSLFFDAVLLVLPIFPVMKLQMSIRKRIGVIVVFALGAGASIAAAYKLGIFVDQQRFYIPTNPTWLMYRLSRSIPGQFNEYGTTFWIPSQVEPTVALIGTSIPALRQLFFEVLARPSPRKSRLTESSYRYGSKNSHSIQLSLRPQRSTCSLVGSPRTTSEGDVTLNALEPKQV